MMIVGMESIADVFSLHWACCKTGILRLVVGAWNPNNAVTSILSDDVYHGLEIVSYIPEIFMMTVISKHIDRFVV